jgi:hypothetical protein
MEKIMSKTNSESRNVREHKQRVRDELSEDKLDAVTGGSFALSNAVSNVIKAIGPAVVGS